MSYLTFHLIFLLPPILVLLLSLPEKHRIQNWSVGAGLGVICAVALIYTTPWDNYLVAQEVWWYGPNRVVGTIGHVPIEEYLFFLLQPILTGLVLWVVASRSSPTPFSRSQTAAWTGFSTFTVLTLVGAVILLLQWEPGLYMALILAWACPILAGMWLYDGGILWAYRRTLFVAVGGPTVYLWVIDAIAIKNQIWTISDNYTLGLSPLGLPVEEATFFLMTNLLVVQGLLLLFYGSHQAVTGKTLR